MRKFFLLGVPFLLAGGGVALFFSPSSFYNFSVQEPFIEEYVPRTYEGVQEKIDENIPVVLSVQGQKYEISVLQGSTVYDLMDVLRKDSKLSFQARNFGGLGFFVEEINDVSQDHLKRMYWIYSINGIKSQVGVSQYTLQSGDNISWSYEQEE